VMSFFAALSATRSRSRAFPATKPMAAGGTANFQLRWPPSNIRGHSRGGPHADDQVNLGSPTASGLMPRGIVRCTQSQRGVAHNPGYRPLNLSRGGHAPALTFEPPAL
jgi:hypothetical protein